MTLESTNHMVIKKKMGGTVYINICIATYYQRVGGGYWKDDRGQELADGVVEFWKGLEE